MNTSLPAPAPKKPRPRWQKIAIVAGGVLVALIVIGAIVGPKKTDTAPAAVAPSTEASPTSTAASSSTEPPAATSTDPTTEGVASYAADLASRPKATDAQVRQIGLALVDIQPEMAEIKVTRIESWADSVCGDIWTGVDGNMSLAARAAYRFNGGDRPELTEAQGQQIVDVITATYCHP